MLEQTKDLFTAARAGEAICITTNSVIKSNGCAVMGAGVAKEAEQRYKNIDLRLAQKLQQSGNHVYCLGTATTDRSDHGHYYVLSFPTKNAWWDDSDLNLIKQSCLEVTALCDRLNIKRCYIPRPGCSNGHLDWEQQVKPAIAPLLDDRFVIVSR